MYNAIRRVVVADRTGLAIISKRLAQCNRCRRRAEPSVAIDVIRSQPRVRDDTERVIVLEKELARVVNTNGPARILLNDLLTALDDHRHGLVPGRFPELTFAFCAGAKKRSGQAVGTLIGPPSIKTFGAEAPAAYAVV